LSVSSANYLPALIDRARVINVNIEDWSVDCVSEYGNKRFLDVQVMSPYLHYMNGEGIYVMPEVGAMCWICKPSDGAFSQAFVLGFGAPHDDESANYRCGRQTLNPGDMMLRTRDENFIILRRGGVIQIGATPLTQRMFIPINNIIHDFCENYYLDTLGGTLEWTTQRPEKSGDGNAMTKFWLKAKMKANEPQYVAELIVGSQKDKDPRVLELIVRESGADGAALKVGLQITNEGNVIWDVKKDWTITCEENWSLTTNKGDVKVASGNNITSTAKKDFSVDAKSNVKVNAGINADFVAKATATIEGKMIKLGSGASTEPAVLGQSLIKFLTTLISQISAISQTVPSAPTTATSIASLSGQLATLVSTKVFVE